MKRIIVPSIIIIFFVLVAIAAAQAVDLTLQPGETAVVECTGAAFSIDNQGTILNLGCVGVTTTPEPTATPQPTATNTPQPTPTPGSSFVATFGGDPAAPLAWRQVAPLDGWDVQTHQRNQSNWYSLTAVNAEHGSDCGAPPSTHSNSSYDAAIYQCKNHVMTALNGPDYAMAYLTPPFIADWSAGEVVISFDMSTERDSLRDWVDVWVTPYGENVTTPLADWFSADGNGEPPNHVHIKMDGSRNAFDGDINRNGTSEGLSSNNTVYESFFTPSPTQRRTFELRISETTISFCIPEFNHCWIDTTIAPLGFTSGVVQFGHHSYNPTKATNGQAGTWHWDNVTISNGTPFSIGRVDRRYVNAANDTAVLESPAPANAYLRFSGIGSDLEFSIDGGATWTAAYRQPTGKTTGGKFAGYFTAVPAGVNSIIFRGSNWYGGGWHIRDITIWSD